MSPGVARRQASARAARDEYVDAHHRPPWHMTERHNAGAMGAGSIERLNRCKRWL